MMGQQGSRQDEFFYAFNLEEHVPRTHLLRGIDRFFDLGELRQHLAAFYSHTGRPSIDPELMIRMLIVGYCFGIRTERRLCEEVRLNLAYRWFCRLDLDDEIPDHSTFSKNRHGRFRQSDALRHVFEGVLRRCMREGLVAGEGFAIDASVVRADANRTRSVPRNELTEWSKGDGPSRAVLEYLEGLERANPSGEEDGSSATKKVSPTDPAAQWTAAPGGPAFYAYSTNYLVDLRAGVIVDVEATTALRGPEVAATKTMVDRVEERFGLSPRRLVGDTAYGVAPMLNWMVQEKHIAPHVPVWDKTARKDDTLSAGDFEWHEDSNEYRCPEGHALRSDWRQFKDPRDHVTKADTIIYRSSAGDCAHCPASSAVAPIRRSARSRAASMRARVRWLGPWPQLRSTRARDVTVRRSKCSSLTSNGS